MRAARKATAAVCCAAGEIFAVGDLYAVRRFPAGGAVVLLWLLKELALIAAELLVEEL